jgi:hypothetical protein
LENIFQYSALNLPEEVVPEAEPAPPEKTFPGTKPTPNPEPGPATRPPHPKRLIKWPRIKFSELKRQFYQEKLKAAILDRKIKQIELKKIKIEYDRLLNRV